MIEIYPEFYNEFKCTADRCPDSCCKDWDVVVDDKSAEFYNSVKGKFGDRLRSVMTTDSDGDRIFTAENGRCPFWNREMLCDIYISCGQEHLCDTCRDFPRIVQDYTAFSEHMLSFACPEAARIMLKDSGCFDFIDCFEVTGNSHLGYSAEIMNFLLAARKISCDFFDNCENLQTALYRFCAFNERVQAMLDSGNYNIPSLDCLKRLTPLNMPNRDKIFELHKKLDIMDTNFFDDIQNAKNCTAKHFKALDSELAVLAKYYVFRYYLTAIDSFDVITVISRILCAVTVISSLVTYKKAENDFDCRVLIFQRYSKEIEHSYENTDIITLHCDFIFE